MKGSYDIKMYFFIGLYNYIMHTLFCYPNEIDRFVILFLLIDLLIVAAIQICKGVFQHYKIIQNIIDQFNDHLKQRSDVIESVRKAFAFDHVKSAYYNILYLESINVKEPIESIQQELIQFGVSQEIIKDRKKFTDFLVALGQDKYQIIVDSQNKKFRFIKKEEDDGEQYTEVQS